jgi:hypothetical protein
MARRTYWASPGTRRRATRKKAPPARRIQRKGIFTSVPLGKNGYKIKYQSIKNRKI